MPLIKRTKQIQLLTLSLFIATILFCLCGVLVAFSYPLGNITVNGVDTTIFKPEISFPTGVCVGIPGILTAVTAIFTWFLFGRTPLQRHLIQINTEGEQLREMLLQIYFDQIVELVHKQGPDTSLEDKVQLQFIQRRTLETLAVLDDKRKRLLLQFLVESQLVKENTSYRIELSSQDLLTLQELLKGASH